MDDESAPLLPVAFDPKPHEVTAPAAYVPSPFCDIQISNPEKHGEGVKNAYVTYDVTSSLSKQSNTLFRVKRRYQDFSWLYSTLKKECRTAVVPPIPERHSILDMLIDRFSPDFIKKRQLALERFLRRVNEHPILCGSVAFSEFLQKDYLGIEADPVAHSNESTSHLGVMESLMQNYVPKALLPDNTLVLTGNPEGDPADQSKKEKLVKMMMTSGELEKQFSLLAKACHKVVRGHVQLASAWQDSAAAYDQLGSVIDFNVTPKTKSLLTKMSSMACNTARQHDKLAEELEFKLENVLKEYSTLLGDELRGKLGELYMSEHDKSTLKERLKNCESEREALISSSGSNISGYLSQKFDQLKGVDPITSRQQKLERLDGQIKSLQEQQKDHQCLLKDLSTAITPEYSHLMERLMVKEISDVIGLARQTLAKHHQDRRDDLLSVIQ